MSRSAILAAAVLLVLVGCGGSEPTNEVRLLAPVHVPLELAAFEEETGCAADVRIYDDGEDVGAIARRRNVDAIAADAATLRDLGPDVERRTPFTGVKVARVVLPNGGLTVTVPQELASAYDANATPAGTRATAWALRPAGPNDECAARWIAHVRSLPE